jgi:hypothetical protein
MSVQTWIWDGLRKLRLLPRTDFWFGDVQAHAETCKYTFFRPSPTLLGKVSTGDLIKVWFQYRAKPWHQSCGERMWVRVTGRDGDEVTGELDNIPTDIIGLRLGSPLQFEVKNILSAEYADPEGDPTTPYWPRCYTTQGILDGLPVDYVSRSKPLPKTAKNKYPDSGWQVFAEGESGPSVHEQGHARYVALGAVLNRDDRWVHLLEEPPGSRFEWDDVKLEFVRLDSFDPDEE